jgi:hypothetical protein
MGPFLLWMTESSTPVRVSPADGPNLPGEDMSLGICMAKALLPSGVNTVRNGGSRAGISATSFRPFSCKNRAHGDHPQPRQGTGGASEVDQQVVAVVSSGGAVVDEQIRPRDRCLGGHHQGGPVGPEGLVALQ